MVVDTSIFIDHYRSKDKSATEFARLPKGVQLLTSVMVVYELQAGASTPQKRTEMTELLRDFRVLELNREIAEKAGEITANLRATGFTVGGGDILIAATCLFFNQPVKTSNRKDFLRIEGLTVL